MEVILLERIERLGQMGDVVKVKPGFARNFLLPEKKALRATPENRAYFESQRAQLEAANLKRRQEAEAVAKKLDGQSVALIRQAAESGQLYGSVTTRDITAALDEVGFKVESRQVHLDRPIKELGLTKVRVSLHPEVDATITVNVAKSDEEAARQMEEEAPPPPAEFLDEAPAPEAEPAAPAEAAGAAGEGEPELSAKEKRRAQRRAQEAAQAEAGGESGAEKGE